MNPGRRFLRIDTARMSGLALVLAVITVGSAALGEEPDWRAQETAVLQGLDKVTARISRFEVPVGSGARFGTLNVFVDTCQDRPPTLPPESAAFLRVEDQPPDEPARLIFNGWMFASSPGLNALEHPVYDVWVSACRSSQIQGQSSAEGTN